MLPSEVCVSNQCSQRVSTKSDIMVQYLTDDHALRAALEDEHAQQALFEEEHLTRKLCGIPVPEKWC